MAEIATAGGAKSAIDSFERHEIERKGTDIEGNLIVDRVTGWKYLEFAIAPQGRIFFINHLPTGAAFPIYFNHLDDCARAILEVATLRNCWLGLTAEDWAELGPKIDNICIRKGGLRYLPAAATYRPEHVKDDMNGFSEDSLQ